MREKDFSIRIESQANRSKVVEKIPTEILQQTKKAFRERDASMPSAPYD